MAHKGRLDVNQGVHEYALTPAHSETQVQETELWNGLTGKEKTDCLLRASVGKDYKSFSSANNREGGRDGRSP